MFVVLACLDPQVNHLFVFDQDLSFNATHVVDPNTDSDEDTVTNIGPGSALLYILYSSARGDSHCHSESEHRAIFDAAVASLQACETRPELAPVDPVLAYDHSICQMDDGVCEEILPPEPDLWRQHFARHGTLPFGTCKQAFDAGITESGMYDMHGEEVYCDMDHGGGGWSMIMNIAPTDGYSVGYNNQDFWTGDQPYGNDRDRFTTDWKSSLAYTMEADEIMIQSASLTDTEGQGVKGYRVWPTTHRRTFDSMFTTGIPSVHGTDACDSGQPTQVHVGTTNEWDDIIRRGGCLHTDINPSSSGWGDVTRLSSLDVRGDNYMGAFASCIDCGTPWQGNDDYMGMDRAACNRDNPCHYNQVRHLTGTGGQRGDCRGNYCGSTYGGNNQIPGWNIRIFVRLAGATDFDAIDLSDNPFEYDVRPSCIDVQNCTWIPETLHPTTAIYRGGHCYSTGAEAGITFDSARLMCEEDGGRLAEVHTAEIQADIEALLDSEYSSTTGVPQVSFWLGARQTAEGEPFTWSNGSAMSYQNWGVGEPDDSAIDQLCAAVRHTLTSSEHNKWLDLPCTERAAGALCQKDLPIDIDGATGTFKFFVKSHPTPAAVDPPVWKTALYYRNGNSSDGLQVYADTYISRGHDCVDEYDMQHGTSSTYYDVENDRLVMADSDPATEGQCPQLVQAGFDCNFNFCPQCQ